jgi:diadenosine tetraphosphate (Ap4A) HIT family hydrolase
VSGPKISTTAIHRMVERCRAGDHPALVTRLSSGWVVMGDPQVIVGYCLLLPDPVVDHLNVLADSARAQFLADMALTGDAVLACTGAVRINYAMFGNAEPALHAHVIPRHADEPEAIRTKHPWALDWNAAAQYSRAQHGELQSRIADHLRTRVGGAP